MATTFTAPTGSGARVRVQKFGTFLSNMIMPNIPALIAWGLLTALVIDVGWLPNADLATMVGPIIHYALPILIAATGGRMVHGDRGAVVGGFAVMGAIAGSDLLVANFNAGLAEGAAPLGQVHMFIGAMILGPLSAYLMKRLDALWDGKVKAGFEMLVNMFSAGILAFVMAIVGFWVVAPVVNEVMVVLGNGVETLVDNNLLPLTSILIEPAKVFFLNNAINHGVLTPAGSRRGGRHRQVGAVPARGEPRSRPRPAARLLVLRPRCAEGDRPRRGDHPVLRRHPRDLLPLRADEAAPDPRHDRRRHDRRRSSTWRSTWACGPRRPRARSSRCTHRPPGVTTSE